MITTKFIHQIKSREELGEYADNGVLCRYVDRRDTKVFFFDNYPFAFGSFNSIQKVNVGKNELVYFFHKILKDG